MNKIITYLLFFYSINLSGQAITGTSGLIYIPSARMIGDGKLIVGGSLIPKPYFSATGARQRFGNINNGLNTYLTYSFTPFIEFSFRYSHELNVKVNPSTRYFPDRMMSFRIRLKEEGKNIPSIAFGIHDFGKLFGDDLTANSFRSTSYLVSSKIIAFNKNKIDLTFGYFFDFFKLKSKVFKGFFYGIEITNENLNNLSFVIEYDSLRLNNGLKIHFNDLIHLMIGFINFDKITASINLKI